RFFAARMWLLILATGCKHASNADEEGGGPKPSEMTVEVQVARVEQGTIRQIIETNGTLAALPNQDVKVSPLVSGRINAILVSEGDRVVAGQLLFKLDASTLNDQAREAKANLENARQNEGRRKPLFEH